MPASSVAVAPSSSVRRKRTVKTLVNDEIELSHYREKTFYEGAQVKYLDENTFTVASDLRALDRLIFFETLIFRWQSQLASGYDFDGNMLQSVELDTARKNIKDTTTLVAQIQNDLGLTKAARDKESSDSVAAYVSRLKIAAREHGIRREKQLGKAIELTKELFSLCGAYRRSSPEERAKLGFESAEDIISWVLEDMKPDFDQVDEHFRTHQQRFWLRSI